MQKLSNYFFYVLVSIIILNCGCEKNDDVSNKKQSPMIMNNSENIKFDNLFRMGPVLFKYDKEWLNEKNEQTYLKIGLMKESGYDEVHSQMYDLISPNSLSNKSYEKTVYADQFQENDSKIEKELVVYEIEVNDTQFWIDFNFLIANRYDKKSNQDTITLISARDVYFYHPKEKKWWGFYRSGLYLEYILNSEIFNPSNTFDDFINIVNDTENTETAANIINNRTMILPSLKFFNGDYKKVVRLQNLYMWYKEKKEISPKDKDE